MFPKLFALRIDPDLDQALAAAARREVTTQSEIARRALRRAMRECGALPGDDDAR